MAARTMTRECCPQMRCGNSLNAIRYAVEAITDHKWRPDGVLVFHVKWLGYENESDKTWEPKENL